MPAVTVGVPVYNGEAYLDGALAALSAQGHPDMEIRVADNASTDSTPAIIAKWAARDPRITVMRQERNIGPAANFESLLRAAQSPWFMFAAYDDLWSPQYVEKLAAAAGSRAGVRFAAPRIVNIDLGGAEVRVNGFPSAIERLDRVERIRALLRAARGGWFYGLYGTQDLLQAWRKAHDFPHAWGFDFFIFLSFILSDAATGDDAAVFYQRETGLSEERYRPQTAAAQFVLSRDFLKMSLRALNGAQLTPAEKLALLPDVLRFARHGGKFRRALKLALKGKVA